MPKPQEITIALFGLINSGKSSIINALYGRNICNVSAQGGETKKAKKYSFGSRYKSNDFLLSVIDTPGIGEANDRIHAQKAKYAVEDAHIVFFVISEDLTQLEFQHIKELRNIGKPLLLIINKIDRLTNSQILEIEKSIKKKLTNIIDKKNIIKVSSSPIKKITRFNEKTNKSYEIEVKEAPDIGKLHKRMVTLLQGEGQKYLSIYKLKELQQKGRESEEVISGHVIVTAISVALNPFPIVDIAGGAFLSKSLINDLTKIYAPNITDAETKKLYTSLRKEGCYLLGKIVAVNVLGSFMKVVPFLGTLMGGVLQGVVSGYAIRILGETTCRYFQQGEDVDGNTIDKIIKDVVASCNKDEIISDIKVALAKVIKR